MGCVCSLFALLKERIYVNRNLWNMFVSDFFHIQNLILQTSANLFL